MPVTERQNCENKKRSHISAIWSLVLWKQKQLLNT
jgi:hypothetical protein